jgi:hypothetical protein
MPTELCWKCKEFKTGVKLCAEDKLCPECDEENERALAAQQQQSAAAQRTENNSTKTRKASERSTAKRKTESTTTSTDPLVAAASVGVKPLLETKQPRRKPPAKMNDAGSAAVDATELNTDESPRLQTDNNKVSREVTVNQSVVDNRVEIEIDQLKSEVKLLKTQVNDLNTKLSFVLSFLQLTDDSASVNMNMRTCDEAAQIAKDATHASCSLENMYATSYSTTAKTFMPNKPTNFKQAAVTAVYLEKQVKDSRKNSLTITGLPSRSCSDKQSVTQLISTEFNFQVEISHNKRLGKSLPDRIQPLLVVLKNVDHVNQILSDAKRQRQSDDELIHSQVFINPHLTKAEAAAAYELRCQRRLSAQQRNNRHTGVIQGHGHLHVQGHLLTNSPQQLQHSVVPTSDEQASLHDVTDDESVAAIKETSINEPVRLHV